MEVYLYHVIFWWGSHRQYRIEMPDMPTCIEAVQESRSHLSQGDENEAGVVLFCGGENQYALFNGEWWLREVND